MFALVQFLVDRVKAIVPVKNIKNFSCESFDMYLFRAYEVFWKPRNGEGTGYFYAVVLLVAETEELVEQRTKRVKFLTPKKLEELLAMTLNKEGKMSMVDERSRQKSKEIQEKRITCEKEIVILKHKLKEKRSNSLSSEETENLNPCKVLRRGFSPSDSSDEDDLVLKSELKRIKADHEQALRKLKEEIAQLKKKNDQLQDLNISLQTQLLSFLKANDSSNPNSSSMQNSPQVVDTVQINHLTKEVDTGESDSRKQNPPPMQNPPEVIDTTKNNISNESVDTNIEGNSSSSELPANELYLHKNRNLMEWKDDKMELSPGIFIEKDQWLKIVSSKKLNESRLVRNIAAFLWDSETLRDRSVTGIACKRYKKDGIAAKRALSPLKVDAVQNGLRFWLKNYKKKGEQEIVELASKSIVRKLLADKIMDVVKEHKRSLQVILKSK